MAGFGWERFEACDGWSERLSLACLGDELFGGLDHPERIGFALLAGGTPSGDAVATEDAADRLRVGLLDRRDVEPELEAGALKNVHRKSENFLVTLAEDEVKARRKKLLEAQQFSNLDSLVLADQAEFDELLGYLSSKSFALPADLNPMANRHVVSR